MRRLELPIHVETLGPEPSAEGETFVLLHGYGGSAFTWRYWAHRLGSRGHVVLVDLKGFGSAPKPADGRYAPDHHAELVHLLILQRDLHNVTLVGHSLGGGIALILALRLLDSEPSRLRRLVIVSGAAHGQRLPPFVGIARVPVLGSALMRLVGARRLVRRVLRSIVYDKNSVTRAQVEGYAEPLRSPEARRALVDTALQIVPENLEAITRRYSEIAVPVLLLWGRSDRVVPLGVGELLGHVLPRARLVVLDRCGHLPAEERPDDAWDVVSAFLDGRTQDLPASL